MFDQNGNDHQRYGKERFKQLLLENKDKPLYDQGALLAQSLKDFQSDAEQRDDITALCLSSIF